MKIRVYCWLIIISIVLITSCGKKHENNRNLAQAHYKLALVDLADNTLQDDTRYKKALVNIDTALNNYKKAEYLALKATILFTLKQFEESVSCFEQALACQDHDPVLRPEILNNYACVLAQQGKPEQANALWQSLIDDKHYLTPEVAMVNQGKLFLGQGDANSAQKLFVRAVGLEPGYLDAHFYLALAAYQDGDVSLAKNEIKTVLFLEPKHYGAEQLMKMIEKSYA